MQKRKKFHRRVRKTAYKFETGKEFVENVLADDAIKLGVNWFGLPSVEEMLNDLEEKYPVPKHEVFDLGLPYNTEKPVYVKMGG